MSNWVEVQKTIKKSLNIEASTQAAKKMNQRIEQTSTSKQTKATKKMNQKPIKMGSRSHSEIIEDRGKQPRG